MYANNTNGKEKNCVNELKKKKIYHITYIHATYQ